MPKILDFPLLPSSSPPKMQPKTTVSMDQYSINCAGLSAAQIEARFAANLAALRASSNSSTVTTIRIQGPPCAPAQRHTDAVVTTTTPTVPTPPPAQRNTDAAVATPVPTDAAGPAILVVSGVRYNVDMLEIGECCDLAGAIVGLISRPSKDQIVLLCFGKYTLDLVGTWRYDLRHGANNVIKAGGTIKNLGCNMGSVGVPPGATDEMRRSIAEHNEQMFAMIMVPQLEAHKDCPRRDIILRQ